MLRRFAIYQATTSAATPEVSWITIPPAKSSTPSRASQPSTFQIQCATGYYTSTLHTLMNSTNDFYCIRSAHAPVIISGVISANVIWKPPYSRLGIRGPTSTKQFSDPIPRKNANVSGFPTSPPPLGPNTIEKPNTYHASASCPAPDTICVIIDITFLIRISPACASPIAGVCSITNVVENNINEVSPESITQFSLRVSTIK
mmetsp:Transcript_5071/g.10538  ORF Transcript_5071/g.10538 Transcript_5071/m.10538 type:complete len:202 (-) Transcript_5071:7-612(-)